MQKQIVYIPTKVEDELPEKEGYYFSTDENKRDIHWFGRFFTSGLLRHFLPKTWLKSQEGYFFTIAQLNEYTKKVIKQTLETAAEKANMIGETQHNNNAPNQYKDFVYVVDSNGPDYGYIVNKQSIIDTFEETFKKFKV